MIDVSIFKSKASLEPISLLPGNRDLCWKRWVTCGIENWVAYGETLENKYLESEHDVFEKGRAFVSMLGEVCLSFMLEILAPCGAY